LATLHPDNADSAARLMHRAWQPLLVFATRAPRDPSRRAIAYEKPAVDAVQGTRVPMQPAPDSFHFALASTHGALDSAHQH